MKTFIAADKVKIKKLTEDIDGWKIEKFIDFFNKILKDGEYDTGEKFCANTMVNEIPYLNDAEFEQVRRKARKQGWTLTQTQDNYQTVSYYLEAIK